MARGELLFVKYDLSSALPAQELKAKQLRNIQAITIATLIPAVPRLP
jgi:hypothetical protein